MAKLRWLSTKILRRLFVDRFPQTFMPKGAEKPPLKIGIDLDLISHFPDLDPRCIGRALSDYAGGPTYKRNVIEGAPRLDLDGNPTDTVSTIAAEHAKKRLEILLSPPPTKEAAE